jgi:hypothetical protein
MCQLNCASRIAALFQSVVFLIAALIEKDLVEARLPVVNKIVSVYVTARNKSSEV